MVNLSNKELYNDAGFVLGYSLSFSSNKQTDGVRIANEFYNLEKQSDRTSDEISLCKRIVYSLI